jgi:hypothetical protein
MGEGGYGGDGDCRGQEVSATGGEQAMQVLAVKGM